MFNQFAPLTRRRLLTSGTFGLGALGLSTLLCQSGSAGDGESSDPLAPKSPHFAPKAKRLLHIFLNGGPSQVDTFDPKPALEKYAGRPLPTENLQTERKTGAAFPSPFRFKNYGESGLAVSELFQRTAEQHADDLCVIRSMYADIPNHIPSFMLMNCGDNLLSRPSVGSWLMYGLGSENQNLPGFVVLSPGGYPTKEAENWQSAFLPPVYQGTYVDPQHESVDKLIANIRSPHASTQGQRQQLDLLQELNSEYVASRPADSRLDARIQAFEMAYRMQMEATDAFDLSREPRSVRRAYGESVHGRQYLIARRLLERGVRVVQLWQGGPQPWDAHAKIKEAHTKTAQQIDGPIAALLGDLKRMGLFQDTLILICGEFGRTPTVELSTKDKITTPTNGRDHNHHGFTAVLAGGGVRGAHVHGATDEFGFRAIQQRVHVHDLHATMLHLLGLDHERLTYRYAGRDFRLTDVHGRVVEELLA